MARREHSELLALLDQRYRDLGLGRELAPGEPAYRVPVWNATDLDRIERACTLHAEANLSDPFAGARMRLHLLRGLDSSAEVTKAASSALAARRIAP